MIKVTHCPSCGSDDILATMQHLADELNAKVHTLNFHTFIVTGATADAILDWHCMEGFDEEDVKAEDLVEIEYFEE